MGSNQPVEPISNEDPIFKDVCQLPKNEGPCDDKIEQYWYDKDKEECYTFDWGKI